jgi:hypothetical protein
MIFKQRIHVATLIQTQILYSIQKSIAIATLNSTIQLPKASVAIATLKSTIPLPKASNEEQTNTAIITIDILII